MTCSFCSEPAVAEGDGRYWCDRHHLMLVEGAMAENLAEGNVEIVGVAADGQFAYRLTEKGKARVEALLER